MRSGVHRRAVWVACAAGALVLALSGRSVAGPPPPTPRPGFPTEGQTPAEVRRLAAELSARLLSAPLEVRHGARMERTTAAKLGGRIDLDAAVLDAAAGELLQLRVGFDDAALARALARLSPAQGPRDARVTMAAGHFQRTPGRPGLSLDAAATGEAIRAVLEAPDFRERLWAGLSVPRTQWLKSVAPLPVAAVVKERAPRIGDEQIREITARLSSFSTSLRGSSKNRIHNISIACRAIDGTVLLPGDLFSYNAVVGRRVPSAGYRNAPVLVNGELEQGLAGGICQVSSTLYNAALLADLEIVRRRPHGRVVSYLPAGRDATVVDGAIDFQFRNSLPNPVALCARVEKGRVVFHVFGHPGDRKQVEIVTGKVSRIGAGVKTVPDPRLAKGKRVTVRTARSGRRVTVTRIVRSGDKVVRREVVSRDYYPPQQGIVRVGAREETAAGTPPGAAPAPPAGTASAPPAPSTPPPGPGQ